MKKITILTLFLTFTFSCSKVNETKKLDLYLQSFGVDLKNYRVVCFVPVDGCRSCIDPTLSYSKKANKNFLLVLSSIYNKSIDIIIEHKKIEKSRIICDSQNLAVSRGLVPIVAPCFYFLESGHVVKIVDLSKTYDKNVLIEVTQFVSR